MPLSVSTRNFRALVKKLRKEREDAGLSQTQVAKAMGISRSTYAKIEAAERRIKPLEFSRLARLYRKSIRDFIS